MTTTPTAPTTIPEATPEMTPDPAPDPAGDLFSGRPARTGTCCRCRGSGQVERPYWLSSASGPIPGAPEDAISALVTGSAFISQATSEAHDLAVRAQRPVAFLFTNDTLVVVHPGDDPGEVADAWWLTFYGETYGETAAQTAARR